jgi:hypothetical protein
LGATPAAAAHLDTSDTYSRGCIAMENRLRRAFAAPSKPGLLDGPARRTHRGRATRVTSEHFSVAVIAASAAADASELPTSDKVVSNTEIHDRVAP